eukprot:scaffold201_cov405-Prasinococcus_capsulatus_cf.AAC.3
MQTGSRVQQEHLESGIPSGGVVRIAQKQGPYRRMRAVAFLGSIFIAFTQGFCHIDPVIKASVDRNNSGPGPAHGAYTGLSLLILTASRNTPVLPTCLRHRSIVNPL